MIPLALLILTLLGSFVSAQNKIIMMSASPSTDASSFQSLGFYFSARKEGDRFISSITHVPITNDFPNFEAWSYSVLSTGTRVSSPSFTVVKNDTAISLNVAFTADQLTSSYGCTTAQYNSAYHTTVCKLLLLYMPLDSTHSTSPYVHLDYSLGIELSKQLSGQYNFGSRPILQEGCSCTLVSDVTARLEMFKDKDCSVRLGEGERIAYGDLVCLKLSSTDKMQSNIFFKTTMVLLTYSDVSGKETTMDITSITRLSCGRVCESGTAYAIFELPVVGRISVDQVVTFYSAEEVSNSNDGLMQENALISSYYGSDSLNRNGLAKSINVEANAYSAGYTILSITLLVALALIIF